MKRNDMIAAFLSVMISFLIFSQSTEDSIAIARERADYWEIETEKNLLDKTMKDIERMSFGKARMKEAVKENTEEISETLEDAVDRENKNPVIERKRTEEKYKEGLAAYILSVNKNVTGREAEDMIDCMMTQAEKHHLDEKMILAVAHTESTYDSDAVSCLDYKGLMQTGDVLAEEAGYTPEELFNPEVSIKVGADYMKEQMEQFDDNVQLALTAYNQGPGSVYAGQYSTDYAEITVDRMGEITSFLEKEGYPEEQIVYD